MSLGPRALALLAYLQPSPERLEQEKRLLPQGPCLPEAQGPGHSLGLTHTGPHLSDSNTKFIGALQERKRGAGGSSGRSETTFGQESSKLPPSRLNRLPGRRGAG